MPTYNSPAVVSQSKWAITAIALIADAKSVYELFAAPVGKPWLLVWVAAAVISTALALYAWFATQPGQVVGLGGQPYRVPRFVWLRRHGWKIAIPLVTVAATAAAGYWWTTIRSAEPGRPGDFRVLLADLDSIRECPADRTPSLRHRIRRELVEAAQKSGTPLETVLLSDPIRAGESREAALQLLRARRAQVLIYGSYVCTATDAEMEIRVETNVDGIQITSPQEPRQAKLTEMDSLALPKLTAKSVTGLVFQVLALSEAARGEFKRMEQLAARSAASLEEALVIESSIPKDSERSLASTAHLFVGLARLRLGRDKEALQALERGAAVDPRNPETYSNWGAALEGSSHSLPGAEQRPRIATAIEKYREAVRLKPDHAVAWRNWGVALESLARLEPPGKAVALYRQAIERHQEALRVRPDYGAALRNWGGCLTALAELSEPREASGFIEQAREKYREVLRLDPKDHSTMQNLGLSLTTEAARVSPEQARPLLEQAIDWYRKSLQIAPSVAQTHDSEASAWLGLALISPDDAGEAHIRRAWQSYAEAIRLEPRFVHALGNWGQSYALWSQRKQGAEAEAMFHQAMAKFAEADRIAPTAAVSYNWGTAIMDYARALPEVQAQKMYADASEKLEQACRLQEGFASALSNSGAVLTFIAQAQPMPEAIRLLEMAVAKQREAIEFAPRSHNMHNLLAVALHELSRWRTGPQRVALLEEALSKVKEAARLNETAQYGNNVRLLEAALLRARQGGKPSTSAAAGEEILRNPLSQFQTSRPPLDFLLNAP